MDDNGGRDEERRVRMNAYMREYNRRPEVKARLQERRIQRRERIFQEFFAYLRESEQ